MDFRFPPPVEALPGLRRRGAPIARAQAPGDDDYSVLKAEHSGFFGTSLELVLRCLGVRFLRVTGVTIDIRSHSSRSSPSRLLKKSSRPASPSVVSPASGRELKEGSQFYRRVRKGFS
jgi:hypothetical protein